eukprot:scaffold22715_cov128-Cylindrotheca_fusiformis.AAC.1
MWNTIKRITTEEAKPGWTTLYSIIIITGTSIVSSSHWKRIKLSSRMRTESAGEEIPLVLRDLRACPTDLHTAVSTVQV